VSGFEEYYDDRDRKMHRAEDLVRQAPALAELVDALMRDDVAPPSVRLMCPRCDRRVVDVSMCVDHNGHPSLQIGGHVEADSVRPSDPLSGEAVGFESVKVRLRCPNKRCPYEGDHLHSRLLAMYAIAVPAGLSEIRLLS